MKKRLVKAGRVLAGMMCAVLLTLAAGCAAPPRVVLYEERQVQKPTSESIVPSRTKPLAGVPPVSAEHTQTASESPAVFHKVRSGDTVYTVSQRYHVPLRELIIMNGLQSPFGLRSGQVLRLPKPRRQVVERGDTIYAISRRYDVALSRLVQRNGITPPYRIVVGQVLRLPDSVARHVEARVTKSMGKPLQRKEAAVANPLGADTSFRNGNAKEPSLRSMAAVPKPPPASKRKFLLPVRGRLLSHFGSKGRGLRNDGVNIAAPRGTPVRAVENGIVVYSGNALLGFGNMVLLRHENGLMTAYAHNEMVSVSRGDTVRRGQMIATVGSSGNVSAPQLHFEIRKGKRAIDPLKFLPALSAKS